jgi:hypothetical protein
MIYSLHEASALIKMQEEVELDAVKEHIELISVYNKTDTGEWGLCALYDMREHCPDRTRAYVRTQYGRNKVRYTSTRLRFSYDSLIVPAGRPPNTHLSRFQVEHTLEFLAAEQLSFTPMYMALEVLSNEMRAQASRAP